MDEQALVERARGGDPDAFGALVDLHRGAVFRTALAGVGSREEAEDVAQEAFVKAYRGLGGYRGEASFKTWLLTIAWRHALRRRRGLAHRLRRLVAADDEAAGGWERVADGAPDASRQLERAERVAAVQRLIRALPPALRDALLLAAAGDHTYDEMSVVLGAPAGTLKWRVSEARRRVRERLDHMGWGHE